MQLKSRPELLNDLAEILRRASDVPADHRPMMHDANLPAIGLWKKSSIHGCHTDKIVRIIRGSILIPFAFRGLVSPSPLGKVGVMETRLMLFRPRTLVLAMTAAVSCLRLAAHTKPDAFDVKEHYTKYEHYIPMRNDKKLFTSIYVPKDSSHCYDFS